MRLLWSGRSTESGGRDGAGALIACADNSSTRVTPVAFVAFLAGADPRWLLRAEANAMSSRAACSKAAIAAAASPNWFTHRSALNFMVDRTAARTGFKRSG